MRMGREELQGGDLSEGQAVGPCLISLLETLDGHKLGRWEGGREDGEE